MVAPAQAIQALNILKWRGAEHRHYTDLSFPFTHRQNRVEFPYIDAAGHDNTGREPLVTPVRLLFFNTLEENSFPQLYNEWWPLLIDGKSGPLEHPLAGNYDAVVTGGNVTLTAQATAGVAIDVNFEEHIEDPEQAQFITTIGINLETAAAEADAAAESLGIPLPPEAPGASLLDIAKQIQTAIFFAQLDALGLINKAKSVVDTMIQLLGTQNNLAYAARDTLQALWAALEDSAESLGINLARQQEIYLVQNPTTLTAFAADFGMTLAEAIELNPGAANAPGIPRGTLLRYYS